ncbi:hypothetical protein [Nocardia sp. bgisy134]|uniref:hypothetical protein n=1 Tax=unclassified Nocardia TaxID=2637762 RepID=UPI003D7240A2
MLGHARVPETTERTPVQQAAIGGKHLSQTVFGAQARAMGATRSPPLRERAQRPNTSHTIDIAAARSDDISDRRLRRIHANSARI